MMAVSESAHAGSGTETTNTSPGRSPVVTRVGNLTKAPVLAYGPSGVAYARFTIATNTPKVPGNWALGKETVYYEVTCFRSLAENVSGSLEKGARVVVTGRADIEYWTDRTGKQRATKRITADEVGASLRWAMVDVQPTNRKPAPGTVSVGPADDPDPDF